MRNQTPGPSDVAIVGMAAIFPGARDVARFWSNSLHGVDAITEVPPDRWDWRLYYDPDPKAPDKIYSKWGGFVPDVPFDPLRYGMPPSSLPSIEPVQLLALEVVRAALDDAGYAERPFPRERTAVVLGHGGRGGATGDGLCLPLLPADARHRHPRRGRPRWRRCQGLAARVDRGLVPRLPAERDRRSDRQPASTWAGPTTPSTRPAARRWPRPTLAVRELRIGAADMVILGGVDTVQNPFTYLAFSKTQAFSPRGRCRPFDASADGIVISEGVACVGPQAAGRRGARR